MRVLHKMTHPNASPIMHAVIPPVDRQKTVEVHTGASPPGAEGTMAGILRESL